MLVHDTVWEFHSNLLSEVHLCERYKRSVMSLRKMAAPLLRSTVDCSMSCLNLLSFWTLISHLVNGMDWLVGGGRELWEWLFLVMYRIGTNVSIWGESPIRRPMPGHVLELLLDDGMGLRTRRNQTKFLRVSLRVSRARSSGRYPYARSNKERMTRLVGFAFHRWNACVHHDFGSRCKLFRISRADWQRKTRVSLKF